jgi:O-antigen/teichoic acid export membrane protein
MALQALAAAAALGVSMRFLRRAIPPRATGVETALEMRLWMVSAIPFAISKGLNILDQQMDVIMLGIMDSAKAVALYTVTQRGTQMISLLLLSVNIALAPNIAQFHADGKCDELQRIMTHTARLILVGAFAVAAVLILWGRQFLALFGPEFTQAYTVIIILSIGQVVNAATGSAGLLLMMTDREREATLMMGFSVALHFMINLVFISMWGIKGAAVAGAISMIIANLGMMWIAWRRLGIQTTALGNPASWGART